MIYSFSNLNFLSVGQALPLSNEDDLTGSEYDRLPPDYCFRFYYVIETVLLRILEGR